MIPKPWVLAWQKWIELGSAEGAHNPGSIDNREVKKYLFRQNREVNEDNEIFFSVSKPLWHYFIACFGGGPAVCLNKYFKDRSPLF